MRPTRMVYGLIACFLVIERLLRQGANARSLEEGPEDRGSTKAIGVVLVLALLTLCIAPLLNWLGVGHFRSKRLAWGGIVAMVIGLVLRIWAIRVLGSFYTRTLRTDAEQHLVTVGPYRLIRHPGYIATLLLWFGAGIVTSNWIAAMAISLPMIGSYWYRIQAEEIMLTHAFPQEYQDYASHTWRLIPLVY